MCGQNWKTPSDWIKICPQIDLHFENKLGRQSNRQTVTGHATKTQKWMYCVFKSEIILKFVTNR